MKIRFAPSRANADFEQLPNIIFLIALGWLLLQLAIALFEYVRLATAAVAFPFPLDYSEGPILDQVLRLAHFENIYRNTFATPPYTVTNNPPLFHLLQAPLVWLFGPAYWYGRLISILSAVAAAGMIGLILHAVTADWVASVIGALAFLSFPYVLQLSVFDRGDLSGLALSLAGLYAIVHYPADRRAVLVSGLLLTAAVYTHPSSALAAPFAALLWLWQRRQRRQASALAACIATSILGLFIEINWLTRGGFFLNVVSANLPGFSWYTLIRYGFELYLNAGYMVIACLCFLILDRLAAPTRSWPLLTSYLCGAVLTAMPVGITASGASYPLAAVTVLCLAAGALIAWTGENNWLKALVVFVLAMQVSLLVTWTREEYIPPLVEKLDNYREIAQIAAIIREARTKVLADEYMGLIPLYDRRLYFQPLEYRLLLEAGRWNQDALIASIAQREYSAILLYEPRTWNAIQSRWTSEIQDSIYAHYRLETTLADTFVYVPAGNANAK